MDRLMQGYYDGTGGIPRVVLARNADLRGRASTDRYNHIEGQSPQPSAFSKQGVASMLARA